MLAPEGRGWTVDTVNSLELIRVRYNTMSAAEKRIADVVLAAPARAIDMTIAQLAICADVSEGTIINFSKGLGLGGFTKLKLNIAANLDSGAAANMKFRDIAPSDSPKQAFCKMIEGAIDAFQRTASVISDADLRRAAELLMNARHIEIYGVENSAWVARIAYDQLMRIGLPAYAVTDSGAASISASHLSEGCVALGISDSGRMRGTIHAMDIARQHGARTVCITSYPDTPLTRICDISLVIESIESQQRREAVISRLTHLLVVDTLCAYIGAQTQPRSIELMDEVQRYLSELRE